MQTYELETVLVLHAMGMQISLLLMIAHVILTYDSAIRDPLTHLLWIMFSAHNLQQSAKVNHVCLIRLLSSFKKLAVRARQSRLTREHNDAYHYMQSLLYALMLKIVQQRSFACGESTHFPKNITPSVWDDQWCAHVNSDLPWYQVAPARASPRAWCPTGSPAQRCEAAAPQQLPAAASELPERLGQLGDWLPIRGGLTPGKAHQLHHKHGCHGRLGD